MTTKESSAPQGRDVLVSVLAVQVVFALTAGAVLILDPAQALDDPGIQLLAGSLILMPIIMAAILALRFHRRHRAERIRAGSDARLMDTVMNTSHEWVWMVDDRGNFTFSSPTSAGLLGWTPSELVGAHVSLVIGRNDLIRAQGAVDAVTADGWSGIVARCRHRDGSTVWMEVAGTSRPATDGQPGGFAGTSRLLPAAAAQEAADSQTRDRIIAVIDGKMLLTAFQPIRSLVTGDLIGVEALTRFVSDDGAGPECWFIEAAAVGLSAELELAALKTAFEAAGALPTGIYVALNISPATCLDPRLPGLLAGSGLCPSRIVLELTERLQVEEYGPLLSALTHLRRGGLRIAVDDAGSGFASMRHVLHIRPDIIKLDRSLIAGIDDDQGQRALGAALAEFSRQIGATLVAEGIETQAELEAVAGIGMTAAQGYLIGGPTVHPGEWAAWTESAHTGPARPKGAHPAPSPLTSRDGSVDAGNLA